MRIVLWIGYYVGLTLGVIGLSAVALDQLLFKDYKFDDMQIISFLTLISCAFLIKKVILPNLNKDN